jgi:hypothetical protein
MGFPMTQGDLPGLRFLDRPVKPFAFALALSMIWLSLLNLADAGVFADTLLGHGIAGISMVSGTLLIAAWIMRSQRMAEIGLLAATFVWLARAIFAFLADPINSAPYGWGLSLCWAFAAGGAYVVEVFDRKTPVETPANSTKG